MTQHLSIRIGIQHASNIRNGDRSKLHYYTLACGNGYRTANFLRLWSSENLSKEFDNSELAIMQSLLEILFCYAFQSLPKETLYETFGGAYVDVGLNTLSPLYQHGSVSSKTRSTTLALHQQSPDPDIARYPDERKKQKLAIRNRKAHIAISLRKDYRRVMEQLARDKGFAPECFNSLPYPYPRQYKEAINMDQLFPAIGARTFQVWLTH